MLAAFKAEPSQICRRPAWNYANYTWRNAACWCISGPFHCIMQSWCCSGIWRKRPELWCHVFSPLPWSSETPLGSMKPGWLGSKRKAGTTGASRQRMTNSSRTTSFRLLKMIKAAHVFSPVGQQLEKDSQEHAGILPQRKENDTLIKTFYLLINQPFGQKCCHLWCKVTAGMKRAFSEMFTQSSLASLKLCDIFWSATIDPGSPGVGGAFARRESHRWDGRRHRVGQTGAARLGLRCQLWEETR